MIRIISKDQWCLDVKESDLVESEYAFGLNIPELNVISAKHLPNKEYYLVYCEPKDAAEQQCPYCKKTTTFSPNGFAAPRIVHHVKYGMVQVDLKVKVPRYLCYNCDNRFSHEFKAILPKRDMTKPLYEQFKWMAFTMPFHEVALIFHRSESTIRIAFNECVQEYAQLQGPSIAPATLALYGTTIGQKKSATLLNAETEVLLDICSETDEDLAETIKSFSNNENIHIVIMDLAEKYRSVILKSAPCSKILIHKSAVQKIARTHIRKVGTKILDKFLNDHYQQLSVEEKNVIWDLLGPNHDFENLLYLPNHGSRESIKRAKIIEKLCKMSTDLAHLYEIEHVFSMIYPRGCSDGMRQFAEKIYDGWRKLIPPEDKTQWDEWSRKYHVQPKNFAKLIQLVNILDGVREEMFGYIEYSGKHSGVSFLSTDARIDVATLRGQDRYFDRIRKRAKYWPLAMKCGRGYDLRLSQGHSNIAKYMMPISDTDLGAKPMLYIEEVDGPMMSECRNIHSHTFYRLAKEDTR